MCSSGLYYIYYTFNAEPFIVIYRRFHRGECSSYCTLSRLLQGVGIMWDFVEIRHIYQMLRKIILGKKSMFSKITSIVITEC